MISSPNNSCPNCSSIKNYVHENYLTKSNGMRTIYHCGKCGSYFSETAGTLAAQIKTPRSRVSEILLTRAEGLGFNAACRVFRLGRSTLKNWEQRFAAALSKILMLYCYAHKFLYLVIEGDELYTKVGKNVVPNQSEGWIIVLLKRSSRFILTMECGRRDRKMFKNIVAKLFNLAERTNDLTLVTDGERRYGNILFEICGEVVQTGRRDRPKKTLRRGIKIGIKNKGRKKTSANAKNQNNKNHGLNILKHRVKFNSKKSMRTIWRLKMLPREENVPHVEERPTEGLQRDLDIQMIIHNFFRPHFTTKNVPAVAIGILAIGMTMFELLMTRFS